MRARWQHHRSGGVGSVAARSHERMMRARPVQLSSRELRLKRMHTFHANYELIYYIMYKVVKVTRGDAVPRGPDFCLY